jgi:nucleotide-binding universal stress UspA family protein
MRLGPKKPVIARPGQPRLLVPFIAKQLDPTVLDVALRITKVEGAVLVPAYLLVVPLEFPLDAPIQHDELQHAMPILEAVELAARRAGVPVDARMERGRTPTDALQRLWCEEPFDRIVVPAPAPGHPGFDPKDLAWMLTNAPSEILILRPGPNPGQPAPAAG